MCCCSKISVGLLLHGLVPPPGVLHAALHPDLGVAVLRVAVVLQRPLAARHHAAARLRPALYQRAVDRLELLQLLLKPVVGLDTEPPLLHVVQSRLEVLSVGLHDVGDHEGGGAGHAVIAVDQDPASAPQAPVYEIFGLLDFGDDGFNAAVRQCDHQVFQL